MLVGRYEILEPISLGATSSVSKARDGLMGRIVALKTLQPDPSDPKWLERFLSEAQIIAQLSHPSIVSLYEAGVDEASGKPYLAMEYVIGQTLEQLLPGKIDPRQTYTWGADLARALAYADTRGVVHGNVKPANILVAEDGRVKLADFGTARWAAHHLDNETSPGTPAFLSPEQIEGRVPDGRSDLFSLGIVLYRLVTGQLPFQGEWVETVWAQIVGAAVTPPTEIDPTLPPALNIVLARCLAKNPANRYASGEELAAALEAIASKTAAPARGEATAKLAAVLHRVKYGWAASLLGIGLFASLTLSLFWKELRPPAAPGFHTPKQLADPRSGGNAMNSIRAAKTSERSPQSLPGQVAKSPQRTSQPKSATRLTQAIPAAKTSEGSPQSLPGQVTKSPQRTSQPESATRLTQGAAPSRIPTEAQLTIEISAKPSHEAVAVFADDQMLFRTPLANLTSKDGNPFRVSYNLPSGQHHLRVALYKENNILRSEKESFVPLRKGAKNLLAIQVTKPSRFLPLRGPGLKVSWPSEFGSSGPKHHASARNQE
jgi:serine/threonine protein kinase